MEYDVVPARHPSPRSRSIRRAALAAVLVGGLAAVGVTALAMPAAAEEPDGTVASGPVADAVATDAASEPRDEEESPQPLDIGIAVTPLSCSTDRDGSALLTLTGLVAAGIVTYDVPGPNFVVGGSLDEFGETEEIELVGMPPGNYYAYAEWHPFEGDATAPAPPPSFDWVGFAIEPCQPDVTVAVTECSIAGGAGTAVAALSNLVAGVQYVAWVTDVGAPDGTPYGEPQTVVADATGTAQVTFPSLPGGREYTAWIDGVWEAIPPWEEPPFLGNGGNFAPLETVQLSVGVDFSTQPCPAVPVKPATTTSSTTTKPTLAATGTDGIGGALVAAVALLGLGAASLAAGRRRNARRG